MFPLKNTCKKYFKIGLENKNGENVEEEILIKKTVVLVCRETLFEKTLDLYIFLELKIGSKENTTIECLIIGKSRTTSL